MRICSVTESNERLRKRQRKTDTIFGAVAVFLARLWNFIDDRDIDKHLVSLLVLIGTWRVTIWAMEFASLLFTTTKSGSDVALVIGAVTAPYMAMQAAALAFYFNSRRSDGRNTVVVTQQPLDVDRLGDARAGRRYVGADGEVES
jgi:hypothetical protein